jgi:transposase
MNTPTPPTVTPIPPTTVIAEHAAERSVIDILSDIKRNSLAPKSLDAETRIRCVEYLSAEGASVPEIAQLLGRSERTIRRDLDKVRAEHSLVIDDGFAPGLAGELLHESRAAIGRIRRVTREKDCPHAARIDGERATIEILDRAIARLQSLGFLPMATRGIRAEVMHTLGGVVDLGDLHTEVRRLRTLGPGEPDQRLVALEAIALDLDAIDGGASSPC